MKCKKYLQNVIRGLYVFALVILFLGLTNFIGIKGEQEEDEYEYDDFIPIKTIEDLYAINDDPSSNYMLMNDIDMSETKPGGTWDFGNGWRPIEEFSGIFDGNGYTLYNMNIYFNDSDRTYVSSYIGLFGKVTGTIRNLGLKDFQISFDYNFEGTYNGIGALAGNAENIESCYVEGVINGGLSGSYIVTRNDCGGIVGVLGGLMKNCYSNTNIYVTGSGNVGGLCGFTGSYANVESCYFAGTVEKGDSLIGDTMYGGVYYDYLYYADGSTGSDFGQKLSAVQMQTEKVYQGFDFTNKWMIDSNSGYPYPQLLECMQVKINSAKLSSLPEKREYLSTDEGISLKNIYWEVVYENGRNTKIPVTQEMLEYIKIPGEQIVKIKFGTFEETFTIIIKKEIPKIEIEIDTTRNVGESITLKPKSNSDGKFSFSSDSYGKATVYPSGKVVFNQSGMIPVTINVEETKTYASASKTIMFEVNGLTPYINVKNEYNVKIGDKINLNAKTDSNGDITYISNRPEVVEVDDNGKVLCKKIGTATITIRTSMTLMYEPAETSVLIVVEPEEEKITNTIDVFVGQKIRLDSVFENYPFNIYSAKIEVLKGNKLVNIDKDGLKALKKGKVKVKAVYKDYTYICEINISKAPKAKAATYDVNGFKIKLPKGFFEASAINKNDQEYKYFYNKTDRSVLIIQVDSSLSDTTFLSDEEANYIIDRIENDRDKKAEAIKNAIEQIVPQNEFSLNKISVTHKETKKGNNILVSLQKKNGEMIYYNNLCIFSNDKMINISMVTYDDNLLTSLFDYIIKKNKF